MIDQIFGRLKVKSLSHVDKKYRHKVWICECTCGTIKSISGISLRRGHTKSCGCLHKEIMRSKSGHNKLGYGDSNSWSLFSTYKKESKIREISFEIDYEDFLKLTKQNCEYCGIEPKQIHKKDETYGEYIYNGLDRVDSNLNYTFNNVVPCCKTCNYAKRLMSVDEFYDWIDRVYNKRQQALEDVLYEAQRKQGW